MASEKQIAVGVVFPQTEIGADPAVIRDYAQAVEAMGARPEQSVHLGDRLDSDVLGARNAGMVSVLVETGGHTREDALRLPETERPDVIAPDLPAVLAWLGLG